RPIAIGKVVAERDPFTYLDYPDTPPPCHVDSSSFIETNDSSVPNESIIKPTKASVMDLLRIFLTANPASSVKNLYDLKSLTEKDIFNLVIAYIPNVGDSFTANQINKWLTSDGYFGRPKSTRQGYDVIKARSLWVLKPEFMGDAMDRTFNRRTFRQMTRQLTGWITVGYCRKSPSKETPQKRLELLQKMVNSLHVNDLCEKVFVSPICRASSDLLTRDISPTATAQSILKQLRFQNGDMQDFLMFAKTTTSSIRLSFNRAELNNRKVILKFDCRKAPVKRSSL
ncbi:hypothetical protein F4703DRAFT_1732381, partial [Phycomyces blakesleeanus]